MRPIEVRAFLIVVVPILVITFEIRLAKGGHQRDLPEDGLQPRALCVQVKVALLVLDRIKLYLDLIRLERILGKVVQVCRVEVRALLLKKLTFGRCQFE